METAIRKAPHSDARRTAMRFVVGVGVVSLFADFTYEGGRGIVGAYLAALGAGPLLAGLVTGGGEFLGYAVRLASGRLVDRSHAHWRLMGVGYALNVLAVPALALATHLPSAASLVCAERLGKGLRNPPRDALLSLAAREVGLGRAFGLHEFLDQLGALLGPLAVAAAVAAGGYRLGFAVLLPTAILALAALYRAHGLAPAGVLRSPARTRAALGRAFRRYVVFGGLLMFGFAHFGLVAYHLEVTHRLSPSGISLLFALAMGTDGLAALAVGRYFDRLGLRILGLLPALAAAAGALLFLSARPLSIVLGAALWGAALGIQETTMRAGVAALSPEAARGTAYGVFDVVFGASWMLGSLAIGALYPLGPQWVVVFSVVSAFAAGLLLYAWVLPQAGREAARP
jgi:MFS family permease